MSSHSQARDTENQTRMLRPIANITMLVFSNDSGVCQMISCSILGFHLPELDCLPSISRILRSPSGWLPRRFSATAC